MRQWLRKHGVQLLIFMFSVIFGVGVAVISVWADGSQGRQKTVMTVVAGMAAFGVVMVTYWDRALVERARQRAENRAVLAEAHRAFVYSSALDPLSRSLKELAELNNATAPVPSSVSPTALAGLGAKRAAVLRSVLIAAVELTAPAVAPGLVPRARCTFYLYDPAADEFRREDHYPHHRVPRSVIDPVGTTHMKTQILAGGGKTFRIDGVAERHSYLIPPGTGYQAVIAVPVIFGTKEVGVLAVDAPEYSDFINDHVTLMESLAAVLAAAYALS
jgi:hypothetical protein